MQRHGTVTLPGCYTESSKPRELEAHRVTGEVGCVQNPPRKPHSQQRVGCCICLRAATQTHVNCSSPMPVTPPPARAPQPSPPAADLQPAVGVILHLHVAELKRQRLLGSCSNITWGRQLTHCSEAGQIDRREHQSGGGRSHRPAINQQVHAQLLSGCLRLSCAASAGSNGACCCIGYQPEQLLCWAMLCFVAPGAGCTAERSSSSATACNRN